MLLACQVPITAKSRYFYIRFKYMLVKYHLIKVLFLLMLINLLLSCCVSKYKQLIYYVFGYNKTKKGNMLSNSINTSRKCMLCMFIQLLPCLLYVCIYRTPHIPIAWWRRWVARKSMKHWLLCTKLTKACCVLFVYYLCINTGCFCSWKCIMFYMKTMK